MVLRYRLDIAPASRVHARYALKILLEGLGVPSREMSADEPCDLLYGPRREGDERIWIRHVPVQEEWTSVPLRRGRIGETIAMLPPRASGVLRENGDIDGDLLAAAFSALSGRIEATLPRNVFGVPEPFTGFLAGDILRRPVVSEYAHLLGEALEKTWPAYADREPRWPAGATWALALSHDVDMPYSRPTGRFYRQDAWRALREGKPLRAARSLAVAFARRCLDGAVRPDRDPRFGFEYWRQIAVKGGFESTLYVAVTSAAALNGYALDVGYLLEDPGLIDALQKHADHGGEIGLHASLWAKDDHTRLRGERERLESVLRGVSVNGVRHHFWALDPDRPERTWRAHAAAGLSYDSSLGLNSHPGYRRGLAWPFHPFDHHRRARVPVLQVPPTLMDGALAGLSADEAREHLAGHLEEVKRVGGAAVLNWHLEQSDPIRLSGVGPLLAGALPEITNASDVFCASPGKLAAWWEQRRARLESRSLLRERLAPVRSEQPGLRRLPRVSIPGGPKR